MKRQTDPYARVRRVQQEAIDALAGEVRVNAGPGCLSGLLCPADAERFDKILLYWVEEVRAAFPAQGRSQYEVGREVRNWFESMVLNKPTAIGGLPSRQFTEEEHARQMSLIEGKLGGAPAPVERSEEEQRRNTEEMVERVQKHAKIMRVWDGLPESIQKEVRLLVNADLDPEPQREAARAADAGAVPTSGNLRDEVKAFLCRVGKVARRRIRRTDFWRVASYRDATQFQRWIRGDRSTEGSDAKFRRVLAMSPDNFLKELSEGDRRGPR